jgi:hypothetical protein
MVPGVFSGFRQQISPLYSLFLGGIKCAARERACWQERGYQRRHCRRSASLFAPNNYAACCRVCRIEPYRESCVAAGTLECPQISAVIGRIYSHRSDADLARWALRSLDRKTDGALHLALKSANHTGELAHRKGAPLPSGPCRKGARHFPMQPPMNCSCASPPTANRRASASDRERRRAARGWTITTIETALFVAAVLGLVGAGA